MTFYFYIVSELCGTTSQKIILLLQFYLNLYFILQFLQIYLNLYFRNGYNKQGIRDKNENVKNA